MGRSPALVSSYRSVIPKPRGCGAVKIDLFGSIELGYVLIC